MFLSTFNRHKWKLELVYSVLCYAVFLLKCIILRKMLTHLELKGSNMSKKLRTGAAKRLEK